MSQSSAQPTTKFAPAAPIVDIASGVISASATSSPFTPTAGISQSFTIDVTAVTGTATLTTVIEELEGSLWKSAYSFPLITAIGTYRSPLIRLNGNRIRYVQTIGGTGSITRQILRVQSSHPADTNSAIAAAVNSIVTDVASTTIAATANTAAFTPLSGISYQVEIGVSAIAAGTTFQVDIQESPNGGTNWRTIYRFRAIEPSSGVGIYKSPLLPQTGNRIRYVQTIAGGTPSVTRSIDRIQSNQPVSMAIGTRPVNILNAANAGFDLLMLGRVRRLTISSGSASTLFLHVHDSVTAVAANAIPIETWSIAPNSTVPFTVADFGEHGSVLGAAVNPRVVLSTSRNTYVAPTTLAANTVHLFAEVL